MNYNYLRQKSTELNPFRDVCITNFSGYTFLVKTCNLVIIITLFAQFGERSASFVGNNAPSIFSLGGYTSEGRQGRDLQV